MTPSHTSLYANTCSPSRRPEPTGLGHTLDLFTQPADRPRLDVPVFSVRLVRERSHETAVVRTPANAARLCCELLDGYDREVFLAVALSTASRVIGAHVCHVGTVDASVASPREVFRFAILCNARSVLVAHNHPSGSLEPSRADVAVSKQLNAAGEAVGVGLVDSLVVGYAGAYTSLTERGLL
ncbi:JAB domain-containing protein [Rubrivirga marina]|uniref:JAB domain-containing protein n=1 Tax=Rubrivirga marina TaxID=1196024 RepID=UPI000BA98C40|nr:JAB domain-containing protein [Rubrivirga marina]